MGARDVVLRYVAEADTSGAEAMAQISGHSKPYRVLIPVPAAVIPPTVRATVEDEDLLVPRRLHEKRARRASRVGIENAPCPEDEQIAELGQPQDAPAPTANAKIEALGITIGVILLPSLYSMTAAMATAAAALPATPTATFYSQWLEGHLNTGTRRQ